MTSFNWDVVKNYLRMKFEGRLRKDGHSPMVGHSIRVGDKLADRFQSDPILVAGGYLHDIYEDTRTSLGNVYHLCQVVLLSKQMAQEATELVADVSYRQYEYRLGRQFRKDSATARWLSSHDIRLIRIKIADIEDNMSCLKDVNPEFVERYKSWAIPTLNALKEREEFCKKLLEECV